MNVKLCDRCGKQYLSKEENPAYKVQKYKTMIFFGNYDSVDLCPDCIRALDEWLGQGNEAEI